MHLIQNPQFTINTWYYVFHSVDYSQAGFKSYCSVVYPSQFINSESYLPYLSSLPFNVTSQILIGQYYSGKPGCAKISNVKISLQYFNSNYVTGFMSDIFSN